MFSLSACADSGYGINAVCTDTLSMDFEFSQPIWGVPLINVSELFCLKKAALKKTSGFNRTVTVLHAMASLESFS